MSGSVVEGDALHKTSSKNTPSSGVSVFPAQHLEARKVTAPKKSIAMQKFSGAGNAVIAVQKLKGSGKVVSGKK